MVENQEQSPKKIKLVISDFHMGKGPVLDDGSINLLEDFFHDRRFIEFIEYYSTGIYEDYNVELILNGDFFNMLQVDYLENFPENCTEAIALSKMESIFNGHREVFTALNRFCRKRGNEVTIIIGNHDPGLIWEGVQKQIREWISPGVKIIPHSYRFDGVYIEHGHQYEYLHHLGRHDAILNRGVPEPVLNLSWGNYFVIQFLNPLKKDRPYIDKVKPFRMYLKWAFFNDMLFFWKMIFLLVRFYLKNRLKRNARHRAKFKLRLSLIKEAWVHTSMESTARKILKNTSFHTVIFGHSHQVQYLQVNDHGKYFNVGCWTDHVSLDISNPGRFKRLTFALISYEKNPDRPQTRLKQWYGQMHVEEDVLF